MSDYLFVYGTLLPELAPQAVLNEVRQFIWLGRGVARGRLYDLGAYPGAILDAAAETRIVGQVCRLPDNPEVLEALDAYEGYYYADPRPDSLFVRATTRVSLADGRELDCWIYIYNREAADAPLVADGDYAKLAALSMGENGH
jgi:gamma-glutamylcyclotransferase (GGCT)/AIG2-like uncharacterized protein YtfP